VKKDRNSNQNNIILNKNKLNPEETLLFSLLRELEDIKAGRIKPWKKTSS